MKSNNGKHVKTNIKYFVFLIPKGLIVYADRIKKKLLIQIKQQKSTFKSFLCTFFKKKYNV